MWDNRAYFRTKHAFINLCMDLELKIHMNTETIRWKKSRFIHDKVVLWKEQCFSCY